MRSTHKALAAMQTDQGMKSLSNVAITGTDRAKHQGVHDDKIDLDFTGLPAAAAGL